MGSLLGTPLGWIWGLGLLGVAGLGLARFRRRAGCRLALAGALSSWLLLTFCANPFVAAHIEQAVAAIGLRWPPRAEWAGSAPPEAIAVLGGGLQGDAGPGAPLSEASLRRLVVAIEAAHRWPAAIVIVSGGSARPAEATAAGRMAEEAVRLGLPAERLVVEPRARDTHENGVEIARILRRRGLTRVALVTSAMHMARARGALLHEGFLAQAVAVPPPRRGPLSAGHLLPDALALRRTGGALHELIGLAYYRMRGWLDPPPKRQVDISLCNRSSQPSVSTR